MTSQLCLTSCTDRHQTLLLDHLITSRCGHPILLAGVGSELARRAGWSSVIATARDQPVTVLTDDEYFAPIAYGTPLAVAGAAPLRAYCPHKISAATLTAITHRAPPEFAASATRVRDALPIESNRHEHDR
jgi:hypothetical protein